MTVQVHHVNFKLNLHAMKTGVVMTVTQESDQSRASNACECL